MNLLHKGLMAVLVGSALFFTACSSSSEKEAEVATPEVAKGVTGDYAFEGENAYMGWLGEKVLGKHDGTINSTAKLSLDDNKVVRGKVTIDMTSITVLDITDPEKNADLTGHLKSDDFFGVATHPTATFDVISSTADKMMGTLTIKGIAKDIEVPYEVTSSEGNFMVSGTVMVDRTEFDVKYGSGKFFEDLGDKTINDEFKIMFELMSAM